MMGQAVLAQFEADHGVAEESLAKVTYIPLDGEGTVNDRVDRLFKLYLSRPEWVADMRRADAVFVAAHVSRNLSSIHYESDVCVLCSPRDASSHRTSSQGSSRKVTSVRRSTARQSLAASMPLDPSSFPATLVQSLPRILDWVSCSRKRCAFSQCAE